MHFKNSQGYGKGEIESPFDDPSPQADTNEGSPLFGSEEAFYKQVPLTIDETLEILEVNWPLFPSWKRHNFAEFDAKNPFMFPYPSRRPDDFSEDHTFNPQRALETPPSIGEKCAQSPATAPQLQIGETISNEEQKKSSQKARTKNGKKVGRKPVHTGLSKRKDVVLKSLLRKIKAYYWNDFEFHTDFSQRKSKQVDQKKFFKACIRAYVSNCGYLEDSLLVKTCLGNLLNPNLMGDKADFALRKLLSTFSMQKYEEVLKNSEFSALVEAYFQTVDVNGLSRDEQIGMKMLLSAIS